MIVRKGVSIQYGDISPNAKENFAPSTDDKACFVDLSQLQEYNIEIKNYANPCNRVVLDGNAIQMPRDVQDENMGYWSESVCGADGSFDVPIVITLSEQEHKYSAPGLTFTFDVDNDVYCNNLSIAWYQDDVLLDSKDFMPDSTIYFCNNIVDYFNRIEIVFYSMNIPYNRLKIRAIDYGFGTVFGADELENVNLIQEIDPLSLNLMSNTCDFTVNIKSDIIYSFAAKQELKTYYNGELQQISFIEQSDRISARRWKIKSYDYTAILDGYNFVGAAYGVESSETPNHDLSGYELTAFEVLDKIFQQANVPYEISDEITDVELSGYIPPCTCRQAVQMICFAIGAVVNTACADSVRIFKLHDNIDCILSADRVRQGIRYKINSRISTVLLSAYRYYGTYDSYGSGKYLRDFKTLNPGEEGTVIFSEPYQFKNQYYTGYHEETYISSNYIKVKCLKWEKYSTGERPLSFQIRVFPINSTSSTIAKSNQNISNNEAYTTKSITSQTLVNHNNSNEILNRCYDYYIKNERIIASIEEGYHSVKYGTCKYGQAKYSQRVYDKPVLPGDRITIPTDYMGDFTGTVISTRFNLNGGIIVKECELV